MTRDEDVQHHVFLEHLAQETADYVLKNRADAQGKNQLVLDIARAAVLYGAQDKVALNEQNTVLLKANKKLKADLAEYVVRPYKDLKHLFGGFYYDKS